MVDIKKIYVASFCMEQKSYHVELLSEMLINNTQNIINNKTGCNYLPFFIGTRDECDYYVGISTFKFLKDIKNDLSR